MSLYKRVRDGVVVLRQGEGRVALMMFAYSFLAMTAHNIIRPLTRSKFINDLGADNIPYVELAAGLLIGAVMLWYSSAIRRLPRRYVIPITQAGLVLLLLVLWVFLRVGATSATVGFYFLSRITGVLLISQFWTLANDVYDARQAKRVFGFIGGGASLGGAVGAGLTAALVERIGSNSLVLVSAVVLTACAGLVLLIVRRTAPTGGGAIEVERGVGGREAFQLLSSSRQLRVLALVVGCAAAGATVVDQQLNMAADAMRDGDAVATLLAQIAVYVSVAGFLVQVALTSRIHRSLGIGFALLLLPVGLGLGAGVILITGALWAAGGARLLDSTLRYTVDKTSREILFLPVAPEVRFRAKPFIDVTADRIAKASAAVLMLVLIKPWGFGLDWRRLGYASLAIMGIWIVVAIVARRDYLSAFRRSIGAQGIAPAHVRTAVADAATIETLVEELSSADERAVLYAIDMLEAFDKRNLVSPLLLRHSSPAVRARALLAVAATRSGMAGHWTATVEAMVQDDHVEVRAAALRALAALSHEEASAPMRRHLDDSEPRVAVTAAMILAASDVPADVDAADRTLSRLVHDTRATAAEGRRQAATALAGITAPRFRTLLVPLLSDLDPLVAQEAIRSARLMGASDGLFIPGLLSLLGDRTLKAAARETLVGYGEAAVGVLAYVLHDQHETPWVRRHVPATLAQLPTQPSMDALAAALEDPDGFLRYKVISAIEELRRASPGLTIPAAVVERRILQETSRYANYLTLRHNLLREADDGRHTLLGRALDDKLERTLDRVYRLLGVLHGLDDVAAVRRTLDSGDTRARAGALEYIDNILTGPVRKRVMPLIDDSPAEDKVRHANLVLKTRPRDLADTLAQCIHDDDQVVAASAIHFVAHHGLSEHLDDLAFIVRRGTTPGAVASPAVEAAAWALDQRVADERTVLDGGFPVVEIVDRIRTMPLFDYVSVDELFRIAVSGQEVRHPAGREIERAGDRADAVHFVLAGAIEIETSAGPEERLAPAALGFEEVMQGTPLRASARARHDTISFRVGAASFVTMVSDNTLLAQGLFRMLLAPSAAAQNGPAPDPWVPVPLEGPVPPSLTPVEQAFLLRRHPFLSRASASQILALAERAQEVTLVTGDTLVRPHDTPSIFALLEGELTMTWPTGASAPVGAGRTVGVAETLAGTGAPWTLTAERSGRALRLSRESLFAVLADQADLLQDVFSSVMAAQRGTAEPATVG